MADTCVVPVSKPITLRLHRAIFDDDKELFDSLIKTADECTINAKDKHGNTPLHLAAMLGRHEYVQTLLDHGAQVTIKNAHRWSPLAEACSYGQRETIRIMALKIRGELKKSLEKRTQGLDKALENIPNFRLRLRWEFTSWIPLLSRILPSDVCEIVKKGSSIRLDTTLVDFTERSCERGDISFLYCKHNNPWTILDNKAKVYQRIRYEPINYNIDDQVDTLMSNDIVDAHLDTKNIKFSRATKGWLWKEDLSGWVGPWHAEFYQIEGLTFVARKRREHLSEEDLKNNKKALAVLTKSTGSDYTSDDLQQDESGIKTNKTLVTNHTQEYDVNHDADDDDDQSLDDEEVVRRESLPPPPQSTASWNKYIDSPEGQPPLLGREPVIKENSKSFKAKVAVSHEFPLTKQALLDILLTVAPLKLFKKLRDFVELKLPDGFPVKVDIPVIPTVIASVTFESFSLVDDDSISDDLFTVPADYEETNDRFPDL